jgi:hypothetical protein
VAAAVVVRFAFSFFDNDFECRQASDGPLPAARGTWFGLCIFKHLSDRHFDLIVNGLPVASGLGLVL